MNNKLKEKNGITLMALVVTVIILIILAGLTVTLVIGQNGIVGKAKEASVQMKQASVEEDLKMMLAEYSTNKGTGDTETLKDYLDKQEAVGKIDTVEVNGSNYDVTLEGYICTIDSNTLNILNTIRNNGPQVSDIKVTSNSNGTGENLEEKSIDSGTTLYITFTATMSDGSNVTVSPNIPYAVTKNGTYNFTLTGKVNGKDITRTKTIIVDQFRAVPQVTDIKVVTNSNGTGDNVEDQSIDSETALYITFSAKMSDGGNVTVSPSIPYAVTKNGTYNFILTGKADEKDVTKTISVKVNKFKIKIGDFVNYSAGIWTKGDISTITYVYDLYSGESLPTISRKFGGFGLGYSKDSSYVGKYKSNKYSSGWRILSLNGDGSIQNIVHAGTPEGFYYKYNPYDTDEYSRQVEDILESKRNWNMYVNSTYAISAHCMTYNEAYAITGSINSTNNDLRTIGSSYWLASAYDIGSLYFVNDSGTIYHGSGCCIGIRPVVTLKSGIQITGGSGTQVDPYQMM